MAIDLVTITGTLDMPNGDVPSGGKVRFRLSGPDWSTPSIFLTKYSEVAVDAGDGTFSVDLQSTDGLTVGHVYTAIALYTDTATGYARELALGTFAVPAGGPYTLASLLAVPVVAPEPASVLAAAQAQAVISTTKAGEASTSADLSEAWAAGTEPGGPGTKSALEWAGEAETDAAASAASAAEAALYDGPWLDTVAALLADTALTYTTGQPGTVAAGEYVNTRKEGFSYEVAASGASDQHITTAGGVKLYANAGVGGFNAKAFAAVGDGVADDTVALQKWLNACEGGGGVLPKGVYNHTGLTLSPAKSYNIKGDAYQNQGVGGSTLLNTNTSGGHGITIDNTPFTENYDSQIRLTNLSIKGNPLSGDGVNADQVMVFLENVWIGGNGGHGYRALRCYSSAFRQVVFANNYKSGFSGNRALNAVHFDHCIFNGNAKISGYAGCTLSGASGTDRNFAVKFTACDFTGNGSTLTGGDVAWGVTVQYSAGVTFEGCYGENNKTRIMYADSTTSALKVSGCFWQNNYIELLRVDGLIYENNEHYDSGGATTGLIIDGGMGTGRFPHRMHGNTYTGTVARTLTGGASEIGTFYNTAIPTVGTWLRGDKVWKTNASAGGAIIGWVCAVAGTPGTWQTLGVLPDMYVDQGDASVTLTVSSSFPTNLWQSPLTADRTVTLSSTNAYRGAMFRITRTAAATGAFGLVVGTTGKTLAADQWCDVQWNGTASWIVTAWG